MDTRYKNLSPDKLRGGYYTPEPVAEWLCDWAIRRRTDAVLEPSCGDGVFLLAAARRLAGLGATPQEISQQTLGIELLAAEANKCRKRLRAADIPCSQNQVLATDFFEWAAEAGDTRFDCIIGNPPFIRYHNFPEPCRTVAMRLMQALGLKPNRLTNIWVPFVAVSVELLSPGGRIAMVLPAELLQVTYAAQLRTFLAERLRSIDMITCNEMCFSGAQQEVVLFLGEKAPHTSGDARAPHASCAIDVVQMDTLDDALSAPWSGRTRRRRRKQVNHDTEKWLKYLLNPAEIHLLRSLREAGTTDSLSRYATVDIGVVTGRNDFFVLSRDDVRERWLESHCVRLAARSRQLAGAVFTPQDHAELAADGHGVYLFTYDPLLSPQLPQQAKAYIADGEKKGYHEGYKCSIREPWYAVPAVWVPDCFLFRQIHDFPRMVLNKAGATSTDTIHRVRCKVEAERLLASYYTHLTAASSEIEGRSYGGGVLELEPTEAERLLVPSALHPGLPSVEIDRLVRSGRIGDVLAQHDKMILMEGMGLSKSECAMLRRAWAKLRDRRHSRKRSKRRS